MNYRLVCKLLGLSLCLFTLSMSVAIPFGVFYGEWFAVLGFVESILIGLAIGGIFYYFGRNEKGEVYRRETLAIVGLSWMLASVIGAIPFFIMGEVDTIADAFFESSSGLTTTGASILNDIEALPKSLLLWRSFLHFLGGLGIIVLFVAILPMMGVAGRSLFKQEVPGPVPEGLTPRIQDTAMKLWKLYIGLNIVQTIILMFAGMSFYDALNHAMSTMATGGYSTNNSSIGGFNSPMIEWIIILFMFIGGTNFNLHLDALKGRFTYFKSVEFRFYCGIILFTSLAIASVLFFSHPSQDAVSNPGGFNFRDALFTTLAIQTTTGFGTVDYDVWPESLRLWLLFLMFVGGCAGSTAGSIKVIRWVILVKVAIHQIGIHISPRRVRVLKIDKSPISPEVVRETLTYFLIYVFIIVFGSLAVSVVQPNMSLISNLSAVISALNNIGPGLDAVGPTRNFADKTEGVKIVLSLLMIIGRLEIYAILVLFSKTFWMGR